MAEEVEMASIFYMARDRHLKGGPLQCFDERIIVSEKYLRKLDRGIPSNLGELFPKWDRLAFGVGIRKSNIRPDIKTVNCYLFDSNSADNLFCFAVYDNREDGQDMHNQAKELSRDERELVRTLLSFNQVDSNFS